MHDSKVIEPWSRLFVDSLDVSCPVLDSEKTIHLAERLVVGNHHRPNRDGVRGDLRVERRQRPADTFLPGTEQTVGSGLFPSPGQDLHPGEKPIQRLARPISLPDFASP